MTQAEIVALLGLNLVLITAVMLGLWSVATRLRSVGFVDGAVPLGMLALALASFGLTHGDPIRKGLLVWLCAVWGIRLGWRLLHGWHRQGEPEHYRTLFAAEAAEGKGFARAALLLVFLPQAVMLWIMALPVQLGQVEALPPMGWIGWIGAGIVVAGIAIENIAEAQMWAFRRDPAHAERPMRRGLWRHCARPDFLGDACVWWGLWLIAAETGWIGVASVPGPILMTYALWRWSGDGGFGPRLPKRR